MKVLSIKEPYASFIKNGYKFIETRSWKTNYRGELFIHASLKKISNDIINNKDIYNLFKDLDMNYGKIICKVNLVDCIYMDNEFLNNIKNNKKEYSLGIYELGRYAWILSDIEPIYPITAKGHLNIWNYDGNYKLLK